MVCPVRANWGQLLDMLAFPEILTDAEDINEEFSTGVKHRYESHGFNATVSELLLSSQETEYAVAEPSITRLVLINAAIDKRYLKTSRQKSIRAATFKA